MCDSTVNTEAGRVRHMYKIHIFKLQNSMPNKSREMAGQLFGKML